MRSALVSTLALFLATSMPLAQAPRQPAGALNIYYIDTEGGQATLFVSPSGESLLVDTGNPGGRDTDRIELAMADAGVKQIDHLVITHYHVDHVGGLAELVKRVPVKHFYDHGATIETQREQVPGFQAAYAEIYGKATHTVLKPGDKVPFAGVDWQIVAAAGNVLKTNMAGAPGAGRPNPSCADFKPKDIQTDLENGQSTSSVIAFGKFRTVDFGDLLWNVEHDLMCPTNRIGTVDLYLTTHHGLDWSNSKDVVYALQPRVAIMNNGTRKGGQIGVFETLESAPGLEDLWQLHWSYNGVLEHNAPGRFIANMEDAATASGIIANPPPPSTSALGPPQPRRGGPPPAGAGGTVAPAVMAPGGQGQPPADGGQAPGGPGRGGPPGFGRGNAAAAHVPAYWIKVSAQADGTFTVTNARNGFSKTYTPRS
jgi:competence protein ComEC